jgi:iduronate 2-sulfatase
MRKITRGYSWFVGLILIVSISAIACSHAIAQRPPNVLFIVSDDLNNSQGCYGDQIAITPNIDRLAARGARFDRAYCAFPLCGPSRNSLLTGLYPNSTGILQNGQLFRQTIPRQASLPQTFRLAGYYAARIGKMYHYNVPNSIGTNGHDDPASWELEMNPAGVDRLQEQPQIKTLSPNQFGGTLSWYASPHDESQHTDALQSDDAIWALERFAKKPEQPFFLSVGFFRPHTPYVAPQAYFDKYDRNKMPIVANVKQDQQNVPRPALASAKKEQNDLSDDTQREILQAYYASISFMDAQLGRVMEALDRLQLAENTIIVFTSDHGYHTGQHGLWQKMSLFEESARVPLIVVAPGVTKPQSVIPTPVSHVDLFPTLVELANIPSPKNLQGQSLVPILKNPDEKGRGWAVTQVTRGGRDDKFFGYSLRTIRWRYTEWDEGKRGRELYDHDSDPRELTNLIDAPQHAELVDELSRQLKQSVLSTFPKSGKTPEVESTMWAPNVTDIE